MTDPLTRLLLLEQVQKVHPDAWVGFDRTAADCGYLRPWFVWSHNDSDMKLLGEGKTEAAAIQDALNHLEDE